MRDLKPSFPLCCLRACRNSQRAARVRRRLLAALHARQKRGSAGLSSLLENIVSIAARMFSSMSAAAEGVRGSQAAPLSFAALVEQEQQADWRQTIQYECPRCANKYEIQEGSVLCCPMFEPEVIQSLQTSSAYSGCKFYRRVSWAGKKESFDVAVGLSCSFFKDSYDKVEASDDEGSRPKERRDSRHLNTCKCKAAISLHGQEVHKASCFVP